MQEDIADSHAGERHPLARWSHFALLDEEPDWLA
jgi:hypothetical protein